MNNAHVHTPKVQEVEVSTGETKSVTIPIDLYSSLVKNQYVPSREKSFDRKSVVKNDLPFYGKRGICWYCGEKGHDQNSCKKKQSSKNNVTGSKRTFNQSKDNSSSTYSNVHNVLVCGSATPVLVDEEKLKNTLSVCDILSVFNEAVEQGESRDRVQASSASAFGESPTSEEPEDKLSNVETEWDIDNFDEHEKNPWTEEQMLCEIVSLFDDQAEVIPVNSM